MTVERIKWNIKGFAQLRKDRGVMSDLIARGKRMQSSAGSEYVVEPFTGKNRGRVNITALTDEAKRDNAKNNSLIRSIDAGK